MAARVNSHSFHLLFDVNERFHVTSYETKGSELARLTASTEFEKMTGCDVGSTLFVSREGRGLRCAWLLVSETNVNS